MNVIPFADEFERAVIIGVLADPLLLPKVSQIIVRDDFFKENHKEIWGVIEDIDLDNLDSLTVQDRITSDSTKSYFKQLVEDSTKILPSLSNIQFYAEVIRDKSRKRAGIELGREIVDICFNPDIEGADAVNQLETKFADFLQKRVLEGKGNVNSKEAFSDFMGKLGIREYDDPNAVYTGYRDVDLMIHKLEGLIILAARTSMGKTAFAINIARNVAETRPVLFFSVEQSREQIFERLLSAESVVPLEDIRTGAFKSDPAQVNNIESAATHLSSIFNNLHIDESANIPTQYIASVARQKHYEKGGLGLIVIDYLHILQIDKKRQTTDSLGDACKEIRALGKELNVPIILLSQLRRPDESGTKKSKRPDLVDLRSSGEIEQVADIVMFLYRDSYYEEGSFAPEIDKVEVDIKKNRNGRPGRVILQWLPPYVKFTDLPKQPNLR